MFKLSHFLRLILWGYILLHLWYLLSESIPFFVVPFMILYIELGSILYIFFLKRKKIICSLIAVCIIITYPFWIHVLGRILNLFGTQFPFFTLYHDLWFLPFWIPLCIIWILGMIGYFHPTIFRFEIFPRLGILLLVFFLTHKRQISLYPHLNTLFLSLYIYLFLEFFFLFWTNPYINKQARKDYYSFVILIFFLLCPGLILLCNHQFIKKSLIKNNMGMLNPTITSYDFDNALNLHQEVLYSPRNEPLLILKLHHEPQEKIFLKRHDFHGYNSKHGFYIVKDLVYNPFIDSNTTRREYISNKDSRKEMVQDFYILNFTKTAFLALERVKRFVLLKPEHNKNLNHFRSYYRAISQSLVPKSVLENDPQLFNAQHTQLSKYEKFTYLNYDDQSTIRNLSLDIVGDEVSPYLQAKKLETYLKKNYIYSLEAQTIHTNHSLEILMDFLLRTRKGYCTYFAFSMALMARSLELPSRVVSGFAINTNEHLLGYYPIMAKHAHAWVEIYFDDFGWINFDPTSLRFDNNLTILSMIHNTYDPQSLYQLLEPIFEKNIQFSTQIITKPPHTLLSKKTPSFFMKFVIRLVVILCFIYFLLLVWTHFNLQITKNSFQPREKVKFWAQKITFISNIINKKSQTPLELFSEHSPFLLEIYRRALFAANFSQTESQIFLKNAKLNLFIEQTKWLKKLLFFFHIAWIKTQIVKNVKFY